jgi:hypothetical protein
MIAKFAAPVHSDIYDAAIKDLVDASALAVIKHRSLMQDANIFAYDPQDHCDDGYIEQGWSLAQSRLAAFALDNTDWSSFGAATHAIADFYAHSSYAHFAPVTDDYISLYVPGVVAFLAPDYTTAQWTALSVNPELWNVGSSPWAGYLISGRYAQKFDPHATFWEGFTDIPKVLTDAPDFFRRGALPHHDEIAVDSATPDPLHKLYNASDYVIQFRWRFNAAVRHVRKALVDNLKP